MDKIKLGTEPKEGQKRDAIHMAVMPVVVAHDMRAGTNVGLDEDGNASAQARPLIGIIDPFYGADLLDFFQENPDMNRGPIFKGHRYWLMLYPGTIGSLRHEWSHPVVDDVEHRAAEAPTDKTASIAWMEDYVARQCPYYMEHPSSGRTSSKHEAYLRFMQCISEGEVFYSGTDLHGPDELEEPDDFFRHLSVILGREVSSEDFSYSCSC